MILMSTENWICLSICNTCIQNYGESKYDAKDRFIKRVERAKDKLKAINENSIHYWWKIGENKYQSRDWFGNIQYMYVK